MNTIEVINGNILDTKHNVIVQQVNCLGRMGSGLAKQIMNKYPTVRPEYMAYVEERKSRGIEKEGLLGEVNFVTTDRQTKVIANIFGQVNIRKGRYDKTVYTDVDALIKGMETVKAAAIKHGFSVAIPTHIGCGLAGGNWEEVKPRIDEVFKDVNFKVSYYEYH